MKKQKESPRHESHQFLDHKSKRAVEWFSALKTNSINMDKIWNSIERRLESADKKILSWFMAMATSFTLLVAAGLEYGHEIELFQDYKNTEQPNLSVLAKHPLPIVTKPIAIKGKLNRKLTSKSFDQPSNLKLHKTKVQKMDIKESHIPDKDFKNKKPFVRSKISFQGKAMYTHEGILPSLGLDFSVYEFTKNKYKHSIHAGWASYFRLPLSIPEDEAPYSRSMLNFVKLGYGLSNSAHQGWQIESAYLLNPDQELFKNTTIKISVHRKINRHIRLGPEIIFTENFNQVMPAISFLFNS